MERLEKLQDLLEIRNKNEKTLRVKMGNSIHLMTLKAYNDGIAAAIDFLISEKIPDFKNRE